MSIALPVIITPSLIINSIILFFVKLVGLFDNTDSFKKSDNASFDTLRKFKVVLLPYYFVLPMK